MRATACTNVKRTLLSAAAALGFASWSGGVRTPAANSASSRAQPFFRESEGSRAHRERPTNSHTESFTGSLYFFSPVGKFEITVTDWLTCCDTTLRRILLPSGDTS